MRRITNRTVMMALLVAGSAAGCSRSDTATAPGPVEVVGSLAQGKGEEQSGLAAVRRATAAFHNIDKAIAAGYATPVGGHCEATAAGAMGIHSANAALLADPALNPEMPEILLYMPTGGGNYRLVGVEYWQPVLLRNTVTGAVAPWFAATPWPAHFQVANQAPSLFGQTFQGPMRGHIPGMPWHYDLHVWAWAPNPAGTFAQWNPSLSCQ